jgi:hypothetical protein
MRAAKEIGLVTVPKRVQSPIEWLQSLDQNEEEEELMDDNAQAADQQTAQTETDHTDR